MGLWATFSSEKASLPIAGELELFDLLGPSNPNYSTNSSVCISVKN